MAKLAASLLTGAALGAMSVAVSAAVAMPWLHASGVTLDLGARLAGVAAGLVLSTALYAALGASVGALVRTQTAAVAAVLVWLLAIEGLLAKVFASWTLVHWLPGAAGRALVRAEDGLSAPAAAAAFATCVALFAVAAARISVPRDIT